MAVYVNGVVFKRSHVLASVDETLCGLTGWSQLPTADAPMFRVCGDCRERYVEPPC